MARERMDDLLLLVEFPDDDVSGVGCCHKVLVPLTHQNIRNVVFVGGQFLESVQDLAIQSVDARLQLTPGEDEVLALHNFQALDPQRHLLQLLFGTNFGCEPVAFGVEHHGLLGLILILDKQLEQKASIDSSSNECRLLLDEMCVVNKSGVKWEPANEDQVLVEDM